MAAIQTDLPLFLGMPITPNSARVDLTCANCGKAFWRHQSTVNYRRRRGHARSFCSRQCSIASPHRGAAIAAAHLRDAPVIRLADRDLGYLTGLIDGEGCFALHAVRQNGTPTLGVNSKVCVANTDRRIVDWCATVTGVGNVRVVAPAHDQWRTQYSWDVGARGDILAVARMVEPLLIAKGEQARTMIAFCERRVAGLPVGPTDLALVQTMKALNQRKQLAA